MGNDQGQPFDVSQCGNPVIRAAFDHFGRHLVCLGCTVQDLDENGRQKGALR